MSLISQAGGQFYRPASDFDVPTSGRSVDKPAAKLAKTESGRIEFVDASLKSIDFRLVDDAAAKAEAGLKGLIDGIRYVAEDASFTLHPPKPSKPRLRLVQSDFARQQFRFQNIDDPSHEVAFSADCLHTAMALPFEFFTFKGEPLDPRTL